MRVDVQRRGRVAVLMPSGDMDAATVPAFERQLDQLVDEGVVRVLWDLHGVRLLPSSAIGLLLVAARRLRSAGGHMAVARAGRLPAATLRTMGILDVFPLYKELEEAVTALDAS